jgi:osmotically-inducible protein OsmY
MAHVRGSLRVLSWDRGTQQDALVLRTSRAALSSALGDAAGGLSLRIHEGVVVIRGEVEQMADIHTYEAIVRAVPGVVDVDNLLRLRLTGQSRPRVLSA